jgi:broad specificity phosphatase PhoE
MQEKHLYIIRHGETEYNRMGIVQGSGVDMPLNETGMLQAQRFYESFKHLPFEVVYTSALQRTHQSVKNFIEKPLPHIVLPELNEISWGDFEGKPQTDTQKQAYNLVIQHWKSGYYDAKIPNGESPNEMAARQQRAIAQILNNPYAQHILVCMHGRAMKSLLCLLLNKPLSEMELFQHSNLCLYQLKCDSEGIHLIQGNDTSFL